MNDPAARVGTGFERRERPCAAVIRSGDRTSTQSSAGDDAESSFRAHKELREVGAGGLSCVSAGVNDCPVGENDIEANDDVFDLAVAVRKLTGAAAGKPTADC